MSKIFKSLGFGLGLETIFLEGFDFGEFGLGKKYRFWFQGIWSWENNIGFGKFGLGKKVWVSVMILVSSFSVRKVGLELLQQLKSES